MWNPRSQLKVERPDSFESLIARAGAGQAQTKPRCQALINLTIIYWRPADMKSCQTTSEGGRGGESSLTLHDIGGDFTLSDLKVALYRMSAVWHPRGPGMEPRDRFFSHVCI